VGLEQTVLPAPSTLLGRFKAPTVAFAAAMKSRSERPINLSENLKTRQNRQKSILAASKNRFSFNGL
jgi:hypothetical protein